MRDRIIQLTNERDVIWSGLKENRRKFDDEWRYKNKNHNCNSKVYAYNGEWFCFHLTTARNEKFKDKLDAEEKATLEILEILHQ